MKPLFNSVVVFGLPREGRKGGEKPHRNGERVGYTEGEENIGCCGGGGVSVMSVWNTKLLSDGEQMSACHCACIVLSYEGFGEARRQRALTVGVKRHVSNIPGST